MSFQFTDGDGNIVTEVYTCTECSWCTTKRHCRSTEDGPACVLCSGLMEHASTIEQSTGMSDFKYRQLLTTLKEEADGVGAATVENIESHFEEGDDFLDAAKVAYTKREFAQLADVKGVGDASAKSIALTIGEHEGWEQTAIFQMPKG